MYVYVRVRNSMLVIKLLSTCIYICRIFFLTKLYMCMCVVLVKLVLVKLVLVTICIFLSGLYYKYSIRVN